MKLIKIYYQPYKFASGKDERGYYFQVPEKNASELINEQILERFKKLGIKVSQCSKCGREIFWLETNSGKRMPVCLDLTSHFADCKFADEFRKKKSK